MRKVFRTKRKRNYKIILFILVLVSTIFTANLMIKNTSKEYIIDGKLNPIYNMSNTNMQVTYGV